MIDAPRNVPRNVSDVAVRDRQLRSYKPPVGVVERVEYDAVWFPLVDRGQVAALVALWFPDRDPCLAFVVR